MANWRRCESNDAGFSETYIAYIGGFTWIARNTRSGKWGITRTDFIEVWPEEFMVHDTKEAAKLAAEMMYG